MTTPIEIPFDDRGTTARLVAVLERLDKAFGKVEDSADDAQKAVAGVGTAAAKSKSDIEKAVEAMRKADQLKGGFWDDNGDRINRFASGLAGAAGAIAGVATGAAAMGAAFVAVARQGEDTQRAMDALGGSYALVRAATRDTVDAQAAFSARLTLTNSGLRISGQELATVARYARDHRQATETADQALQRLTQSLREGEQGGLRQFGISVSQNATRAMTFESALRQMARANAEAGPVARTFSEDVTRLGSAVVDAGGALASFITRATGLQGILSSIADRFRQVANDARELTQTTEDQDQQRRRQGQRQTALQGFGAAQGQLGRALDAAGLSRDLLRGINPAGLTPEQQTTLAQRMAALARVTQGAQAVPVSTDLIAQRARVGLAGGGADRGPMGSLTSDADLDAMAAAVRVGRRGGDIQAQNRAQLEAGVRAFVEEARRTAGQNAADAAAAARAQQQGQQGPRDSAPTGAAASNPIDVMLARLALGRVNETINMHGLASPDGERDRATRWAQIQGLLRAAEDTGHRLQETELARIQRLTAARQAYHDAVMEALREEAQIRQGLDQKTAEGIERNSDLQRRAFDRARTELERQRAMMDLDTTQAAIQAGSGSAYIPTAFGIFRGQNPADRRARLGTRASALEGNINNTTLAISDAQSAITSARTEAQRLAAESRRNELLQQRITLYGELQQVEQQQLEIDRQSTQYTREFADSMVNALGSTADAFAGAAVAALEGSKTWGEALNEMLRDTLRSLAKESIVQALKNTAIGLGMLAVGNIPASTNAFAAAGMWAAVGVASGAGIAAMGPPPDKSKAKTSGGSDRAASADKPRAGSDAGQPLVLNISVSGALFNEGVEEGIVQGLDRAAARGVLPRYAQTLGGRD